VAAIEVEAPVADVGELQSADLPAGEDAVGSRVYVFVRVLWWPLRLGGGL
jgi:hypothetical protein